MLAFCPQEQTDSKKGQLRWAGSYPHLVSHNLLFLLLAAGLHLKKFNTVQENVSVPHKS